MTESTTHSHTVIESVSEEVEVEKVPGTLLCKTHLLMMFSRKIKELCQDIHNTLLGNKKINDCFLIDVELKNESFVLKSLKCFSNFINRDCSAKLWNRHSHLTNFIKPKQNHSLSLKDYWFNRLNGYALGNLCHIDDIAQYLEQYTVINGISILDRSLTEIEVVNLIYAAITLVGIHILKPFLGQENQVFYLTNIIPEIA